MSKIYQCPDYITALLQDIRDDLDTLYWNEHQKEYHDNPFSNSGNVKGFNNGVFEVHSYDWGADWEDEEQQPNFACGGFKIWWYKYLGRGMYMNKNISPRKMIKIYQQCKDSLYDKPKA